MTILLSGRRLVRIGGWQGMCTEDFCSPITQEHNGMHFPNFNHLVIIRHNFGSRMILESLRVWLLSSLFASIPMTLAGPGLPDIHRFPSFKG